jgi:hypothetical protein
MRGLRLAGAFGFGVLVATGCAVGVVGEPVDTESDGSVPTADASSTVTTRPPDSSPDASVKDAVGSDVVVPPTDSGGDTGACNGKLVINEIQTEGTSADHEYVEIYNTGTCDVSLEGWTLKYSSANGSTPSTFFNGLISHKVLAKGHFVVACSPFPGLKNATYLGGKLAADDGQVGLFNKLDSRVDGVGYGTIPAADRTLCEGNPAPTPGGPAKSIQRIPNGNDTDNNQADFRSATPTPNLAN